jgi:hypothetical protein
MRRCWTKARRASSGVLVEISSPSTRKTEISKILEREGLATGEGFLSGTAASASMKSSASMAANVARPIGASPTVMSSGEDPTDSPLEEGCFGRSLYRIVSTLNRIAGSARVNSSAIAASVSRPIGADVTVISGADGFARAGRGGLEAPSRAGRLVCWRGFTSKGRPFAERPPNGQPEISPPCWFKIAPSLYPGRVTLWVRSAQQRTSHDESRARRPE